MQLNEIRNLAIKYHGDQKYAGQPYIIHLDMVQRIAEENKNILLNEYDQKYKLPIDYWNQINALCYLHDAFEDTDMSEQDLTKVLGEDIAERNKLLSRNLSKHIDDYYYHISKDLITSYVKLCDRLANVSYSLKNPSDQSTKVLKKYRNEQPILKNYMIQQTSLKPMIDKLDHLLKE